MLVRLPPPLQAFCRAACGAHGHALAHAAGRCCRKIADRRPRRHRDQLSGAAWQRRRLVPPPPASTDGSGSLSGEFPARREGAVARTPRREKPSRAVPSDCFRSLRPARPGGTVTELPPTPGVLATGGDRSSAHFWCRMAIPCFCEVGRASKQSLITPCLTINCGRPASSPWVTAPIRRTRRAR